MSTSAHGTRSHRSVLTGFTAIMVGLSLIVTACAVVPPVKDEVATTPKKTNVSVEVLYARGDTGGHSTQKISLTPSPDGDFSIDISENEVSGFGDMIRAASWNAVMVATVLTGASLSNQYRFELDGWVDGPSAGGLTTAAVLSLFHGDDILDGVSMTGTINPTGTIGPVGGIPQKLQGVIDSGEFTKILIPAGQRNASGPSGVVDVVALGASAGVEVVEVADIYEAYRHLTGKELPVPADAGTPRPTEEGYAKLKVAADAELAGYQEAVADFGALSTQVQEVAFGIYQDAADSADRARNLQSQGLQGGAFTEALYANFLMRATTEAYTTAQLALHEGTVALVARLSAAKSAEAKFMAFLDQLGTYTPKTLPDVETLVTAYGNAFEAYSLLIYATDSLDILLENADSGAYSSIESLLDDAMAPLLLFEFASVQVDAAKAIFEVGRDNGGAPIAEDIDLDAVGSFFRRGADANWEAFETGVLKGAAERRGVSTEVFRNRVMDIDLAVALSYTAKQTLGSLQSYIGKDEPNAAYAAMGYGFLNYARNALHVEKYYSNGVLDENFEVVGVRSEVALTRALDLGKAQVARAVSVLASKNTMPLLTVGAFEQAGVDRERGFTEKFSAIQNYSGQFIMARILAFVGGFPAEGYER
ncbi:hypothetical protein GCM10022239_21930 [Leifsonia bigeumensis]|uniref:Lon proteolytic domain-containing protein n=1 Tax=Leifsonella bigeumensis TaxID=433643 RepID=A0ABP7FQV6_9MICO